MAKLEFQLSTEKARSEISKLNRNLGSLKKRLESFGADTAKFDATVKKLAEIKGINQKAVTSVEQFTKALKKFPTSAKINNITKALVNLSNVKAERLGAAMERINRALNKLVVPAALRNLAPLLTRLESSTKKATTAMKQLDAAMQKVRTPRAFANVQSQFKSFNAGAQLARGNLSAFNGVLGTASGLLTGFGVALGAVGFANFVRKTG